MNKFVRYYNQNRREIFLIAIIILFAIFLLHFINYGIAKKHNEELLQEKESNTTQNIAIKYDESINTYQAISGKKNDVTSENDIDNIIKFIGYCNEGNIDEAYGIISDECKDALFPSLDDFKHLYYDNNFSTNKSYSIQNWSHQTYKVDLKENMLHTGKTNMNNIQDFITVVKYKNEYKLNINNFIGKKNINKTSNMKNITIEVISKNTFMSYETYNFKITNDNDFAVYLDELNETDTIYLTDKNDLKYIAYSHELSREQLKINPHTSITPEIKFTNAYIVDRDFEKITFSNVLLDNEEQEKTKISVKLK